MSKTSFTEKSRKQYFAEDCTFEQIQTGCLQRIADGIEKMAVSHSQLLKDLQWYQGKYREHQDHIVYLNRQISSLKGVITKLKKKQK